MEHPGFFERAGPFSLKHVAEVTGAEIGTECDGEKQVEDIKTLDTAGPQHLSFLDNAKYIDQFRETRAAGCFISPKHVDKSPDHTVPLIADQPYHCFAKSLFLFYPQSRFSQTAFDKDYNGSSIHPTAQLEDDVVVEPGAVIGPEVRIGRGTRIAAGAVIGYRVYIGRECYIGPNSNITHTLIGDKVIIHAGVSSGQDGFGFAMGPGGHLKIPQIGRVVIQDDVEIGANSAIDRGALSDTIIGQGSKIDNLVQIAHNVVIGNHCVIAGQCGISGSTTLEDYVVLAGQVGVYGHLTLGMGAQIGAKSAVSRNVPPGEKWSGNPAEPLRNWQRSVAVLRKLTTEARNQKK